VLFLKELQKLEVLVILQLGKAGQAISNFGSKIGGDGYESYGGIGN
jgi:hypothetical protein